MYRASTLGARATRRENAPPSSHCHRTHLSTLKSSMCLHVLIACMLTEMPRPGISLVYAFRLSNEAYGNSTGSADMLYYRDLRISR